MSEKALITLLLKLLPDLNDIVEVIKETVKQKASLTQQCAKEYSKLIEKVETEDERLLLVLQNAAAFLQATKMEIKK